MTQECRGTPVRLATTSTRFCTVRARAAGDRTRHARGDEMRDDDDGVVVARESSRETRQDE